jgi:RNA-splicing ligase RtcB
MSARSCEFDEQDQRPVVSWATDLDDKACAQAINTSRVVGHGGHVALMPDAHWGLGCTIGSAIATVTTIVPSAVGVDIGCGVVAGAVEAGDGDHGTTLSADLPPHDLDALGGE